MFIVTQRKFMKKHPTLLKWFPLLVASLFLSNCGGGGGGDSTNASVPPTTAATPAAASAGAAGTGTEKEPTIYDLSYRGLTFYYKNIPYTDYKLDQLTNSEFNALDAAQKLQVANKLLSTLFFGYPYKTLKGKIASGTFIDDIQEGFTQEKTDRAWLESYIVDEAYFRQTSYNEQVAVDILSRFFAMKELDKYYIENWTAYILTQTIMFSPAYELESTSTPNIARVYNRLVTMISNESGMRYIGYVHMMSEDNWRRFRSPEDNGREMLEIFALDEDDSHVPIAGKALQNWKLDRENDTLVVSLNQNTEPLSLFGTTIYNGDDFYRELVKSDLYTKGVVSRLVNFFFPDETEVNKNSYIAAILSSQPETWHDILMQIVFSEAYLLHSEQAKSAEELFFPLAKKTDFKHRTGTLHEFKDALDEMHQATMRYKLGKLERVPLDTLSFANYHKFIRERVMMRKSNPKKIDDYAAWDRQGWSESFVDNTNFSFNSDNIKGSLNSLIHYLFNATIGRTATASELALFQTHMLITDNSGETVLRDEFNMFRTNDDPMKQKEYREYRKRNIAIIVLDYLSRLEETYMQKRVK